MDPSKQAYTKPQINNIPLTNLNLNQPPQQCSAIPTSGITNRQRVGSWEAFISVAFGRMLVLASSTLFCTLSNKVDLVHHGRFLSHCNLPFNGEPSTLILKPTMICAILRSPMLIYRHPTLFWVFDTTKIRDVFFFFFFFFIWLPYNWINKVIIFAIWFWPNIICKGSEATHSQR